MPPPRWLDRSARAVWRRTLREANGATPNWLQTVDLEILAAFAFWAGVLIDAGADVAERGSLVPGRSSADEARGTDNRVRNRSIGIAAEATRELRALAVELGLSPKSRHGLYLGDQMTFDPDWDDLFD
jgi:P27 family predicted phage terminase small subunit